MTTTTQLLKAEEKQQQRMHNANVSKNILEQLGSNKFRAMTGARNFVIIDNGLQFRIPKAQRHINLIQIKLNGLDLYDISFLKVRGSKVEKINSVSNAYSDQLQAIFTENTGLYTHL